ncbi:MAG: C40 family peptidase [Lachnospiraceae bacterium]|jgi:cell wall-associated NlpC family hydrolase|nr:C40 family peptidase [Lachnospiraceae bacterium]
MTRKIKRVAAVVLISSMLFSGIGASASGLEPQISRSSSPELLLTEEGLNRVLLKEDEQRPEKKDGKVVGASMAGLSQALDEYFAAVSKRTVSVSYEMKVARIASEEIAAKAVVLDQYEHLGIVVVDNYLNVREKPSLEGRIIGKMLNYSACNILDTLNGWYYIESGEVTGYISADYVVTGDEAVKLAMEDAKLRAAVNTEALNVRKGPSIDSEVLTQITTNERYEVLEVLDGWVKIALGSYEVAYVAAEYVEVGYSLVEAIKFEPVSEATLFRQNVVNYALQFLGNPYVWGGTSLTRGADCSGFVQSVLANFGVWVPRVSRQQAGAGVAVNSQTLKPGDLVFYGTGGVVNHVAMYIGNGQIVHAISESRGIGITSMWFSTPMGYRNVIGE